MNIVVTCTKRKSVSVSERLQFRCIRSASVSSKSRIWCEHLVATPAIQLPARQLYSGDHWSVARSIENQVVDDTPGARLWIASAGYGLIAMGTPLKPYSATFSANHPDSVVTNTTSEGEASIGRQWWEVISGLTELQYGGPRSISELASMSPNQPLLIVASETYLSALRKDLEAAHAQLNNSDLLSIFSAGCKSLGDLSNHLIPYDARMQSVVGGALRSLNIRVAQKAILERRKSSATCSAFRQSITRLIRQLPELKRFHRQPMTDVQLKAYIKKEIAKNPSSTHTRLLRRLRDQGQACEQKRFAALFREVQEYFHGS